MIRTLSHTTDFFFQRPCYRCQIITKRTIQSFELSFSSLVRLRYQFCSSRVWEALFRRLRHLPVSDGGGGWPFFGTSGGLAPLELRGGRGAPSGEFHTIHRQVSSPAVSINIFSHSSNCCWAWWQLEDGTTITFRGSPGGNGCCSCCGWPTRHGWLNVKCCGGRVGG